MTDYNSSFTGAQIDSGIDRALNKLAQQVEAIETITGTSYNVLSSDAGKIKRTTSADAVTITYDDGVLSARDVVTFRQGGAGPITIEAGTGTPTLNGDASTDGQHTALQIVAVSGSEIDIYGGVA